MDLSDHSPNFCPWLVRGSVPFGTGLELAGGWTLHHHGPAESFGKLVRHGVYAVRAGGDVRVTLTWDTPDLLSVLGQVGPVIGVRPPQSVHPHRLGWGPVWDISQLGTGYMLNVFDSPAQEALFTPGVVPPWWRYQTEHVVDPLPVLERATNVVVMDVRDRKTSVVWNDKQVWSGVPVPEWCSGPWVGVRAIEISPLPGTPGWDWATMGWTDTDNPCGEPGGTRCTLNVVAL